jgi:hypothetical protein
MRATAGDLVYHVLNRASARMGIFEKPEDYDAFVEKVSGTIFSSSSRVP